MASAYDDAADPDGGYPPEDTAVIEDDMSEPTLGADNPFVVRIRKLIADSLKKQQTTVTEELREKAEEVKRLKRQREDVGVELYGVQQQLARMQMNLEKTYDNFKVVSAVRGQTEQDTRVLQDQVTGQKKDVSEQRKRLDRFQSELDRLNSTLKQVETYNEQVKGEIAVTRRATYKAEEQVQELEKTKSLQDRQIDEMMQRMKSLQDQLAMYTAQLHAQEKETKGASETLSDAAKEMEKINFDKKQLMGRWKSCLLLISRRDERLTEINDSIKQWREKEQSITGEISSYKKSIKEEQDKNEQLVSVRSKIESEHSFLQKQLEVVAEKKAAVAQQYSMLKQSMEQSEQELSRLNVELKGLEEDSDKVDAAIVKTSRETQDLEQNVLDNLSDQTTLHQGTRATAKETSQLRNEVNAKENESIQVKNELARIQVDSLNTMAHNEQLSATLHELDEELRRKETLIAKYETEIRRRNDEIEKKMRDLDGLNRKYEQIMSKFSAEMQAQQEAIGPLEATIHNLNKEIEGKQSECSEVERMWMSSQTELVRIQKESDQESSTVQDQKSQLTIQEQKRLRLQSQVRVQQSEVKELEQAIKILHRDLARLNDLIAQNTEMIKRLETSTFTMESDCINSLKEQEEEVRRLEASIVSVREEKDRVQAEVVELERQIMLTERKIELEKETASAYNQEDDSGDVVAGMKKEIHRMELRVTQLQRRQEQLMVEIERAIYKREVIGMRGKGKKTAAGTKAPATAGDVRKQISDLGSRIRDIDAECNRHEQVIKSRQEELENLGVDVDEIGALCREQQRSEDELQTNLYALERSAVASQQDVLRSERAARRFEAVLSGKLEPGDSEQVVSRLRLAEEKFEQLRAISAAVQDREPRFAPVLDRVLLATGSS